MKKIFLSFLLLASLFTCVACGKKESTPVLESATTKIEDVYVNSEVTIPSVSAKDDNDGDLTSKIVIKVSAPSGEYVNVSNNKFIVDEIGKYTVVYSITNSSNRIATKSFEFNSKDLPAPTISLSGEVKKAYVGDNVSVPAVTCTDIADGDLTNSVTYVVNNPNGLEVAVSEGQYTVDIIGTYKIIYSCVNSNSKSAELVVEQEVIEVPSAVISLSSDTLAEIKLGQSITLPTATAKDEIDGDISTNVSVTVKDANGQDVTVIEGKVTPTVEGLVVITYTVKNSHEKETTKQITCNVKDADKPTLTSDIESIGKMYKGMTLTLPVVTATDEVDGEIGVSITVKFPDGEPQSYSSTTLVLDKIGEYVITYSATNNASKTSTMEFTFTVDSFKIGWDARMYTAGISTMTKTIANAYKTAMETKLVGTKYEGVDIEMISFDQEVYLDLGTAINASGVEVIVGFTSTTFNSADAEKNPCGVVKVAVKYGVIATAENRCVATLTDSELATLIYNNTDYTEASKELEKNKVFEDLQIKQIVVGWFKHTESTESRIAAVEAELERYLAEKGYSIDIVSVVIAKASGSNAYQDTHDAMVESEMVLGFNWGSNFNLANGFMFTTSRTLKTVTFGSTSSRCVSCMVKQNNIYPFYNDLFDYMCGETMTAIYLNN